MDESVNLAALVVWVAFGLALVLGYVAARTNFCTMGAISDVVNMGHWGRVRMWLLAIAVAMIGTNLLYYGDLIDLSKSIHQRPSLPWLSMLAGGLLMGFGGVTAMGCTIGQGMSGVSTLAIGSFIALSGIVAGSVATMKWQQR